MAGLLLAASGNAAAADMEEVRDAILRGADVVPALEFSFLDGQTLVDKGRRLNAYNALAHYFYWDMLPAGLAGVTPKPPVAPPPPPPPSPRVSHCCC